MKKYIIAIGIVAVLVMGIILYTKAVPGVNQSIQEYFDNDVIGETKDIAEEYPANIDQKDGATQDEIDVTLNESGEVSNQINPDSTNQGNENQDGGNQDSQVSQNQESDSQNQENDSQNQESDSQDSQDSQNQESDSQDSQDSQNQDNDKQQEQVKSSLNNGISQGTITNNEAIDKSSSSDVDLNEMVEAALNITNPSIDIDASSAILLDSKTGKVLYHKNATTTVYPASTTKLMTALVALDICDVSEEVTVGDEISFMALDSSRAYLAKGERLTLQMLLEGMLVPSGNDAAYAIAAYVGRVSLKDKKTEAKIAVQEFIELMNEKAVELGLMNTHFMNPDGYDAEGQYTSAYDMGMIAIEALKNQTIRTIAGKSHARNVFLSGEDVTWYSSNKLINSGSGQYYKYAIGLKTGSSSLAGRCLVSAAEKDDCTYVSVIMNSSASGRWEDSIALLEYGIQE